MTKKQSIQDRVKRINEGRCPIHGLYMPQVGYWEEQKGGALDGAVVTEVECPRKDCNIRAKAAGPDGPWELLPEWKYLLQDG